MAKIKTLQPRVQLLATASRQPAPVAPASWRAGKLTAAARGYGHAWRVARAAFLRAHPLCAYCALQGVITPADLVDHIAPHKGDALLFWDRRNWQPLCTRCHDTIKRKEEYGAAKAPAPRG